ncbi:2-phosphosulfolactate phosphatase [Fictibacillus terranigra]|uniref:Probable 2-phosphosulfolactate phosphatase n=1 Tax=Fictibacillus terranigra TaxID=3058424 RepID=A0ABT8E5D8_9BACL|nr:2-phosphosulfolactate phosphatase [Fictibacillus sp. CENA-BCM004]MDN4073131.1 2-phosphosulfolactate phosphatase [Fictibacillus sp. CENA-BCM004]
MKVHLLLKKEEILPEKMAENSKVAVVLDVLLATTAIVSALYQGAKGVIPVKDHNEARELSKMYQKGGCILAGELHAKPITGFLYPSPLLLSGQVQGKTLILSTTNGTVALRNTEGAQKVYISSLLNNKETAKALLKHQQGSTIVIICSGNSGEVSLEDVYGAGHLITSLIELADVSLQLSDAARTAYYLYKGNQQMGRELLESSYVGHLFARHGLYSDLQYASTEDAAPVVAVLEDGKATIARDHMQKQT